jgi:uncharacterized repeat protein (TIGR03803 family)
MRWRRLWVRCSFIGLSSILSATPAQAQVVNILHSFTGGASDGQGPGVALLLSGSNLYGMTDAGGIAGDGTIYMIGADGNAYTIIRSFAGLPSDGSNPNGALIRWGATLYGMTLSGGSTNNGTAFRIGADGTAYGLTHQFAGGPGDGSGPNGALAQSGQIAYGMTRYGGAAGLGTIFKTNADGTGYAVLHSFAGGPADGQQPLYTTLVAAGSTLYGMTFGGGTASFGTVFKMNTDGTAFAVLHSFTGGSSDGEIPYGSLTLSGSTLYGTTAFGGASNKGTIFQIGTDGSGFSVMHSFAGGPNDGGNPEGALLLSGAVLYGMTPNGGNDALGTLFGIGADGSGFEVLHSFAGGPGDGASPFGELISYGANLYGTTDAGGIGNLGTVFSFTPIPEPSSFYFVAVAGFAIVLRHDRRRRAKQPSQ